MTVLDDILAGVRADLAAREELTSLETLAAQVAARRQSISDQATGTIARGAGHK